jgi:fatty acid synthase
MLEKSYKKLPVMFKNVTTMRATLLIKNTVTSLIVNICKTTGYFEVFLKDDSVPLSTGWIFVHENCEDKCSKDLKSTTPDQYKLRLGNDDFYKFMHLRGLSYDGIFLGVQECDYVGRSAVLKWNENWIAFMDTMVQYILGVETREHCVPTGFEKIVIHPEKHLKCVSQNTLLQLSCDDHVKSVRCGGVEMTQISGTNVQRHRSGIPPVVGSCLFIPNSDATKGIDSFIFSVNLAMQIVHENSVENLNVKVAETESNQATEILKAMMERVTFKRTTFHKIGPIEKEIDDSYDFLITQDIKPNQMKSIENCSKSVRFIFGKVDNNVDMKNFEIIFQHATESGSYVLFRRSLNVPEQHTVIMVNNNNFQWLEDLKALIKKGQNMQSRIYLVNEDYDSGIVGFFNSMRQEQSCPNLRVFLIRDKNREPFSLKSKFYLEQIRKDMTVNIYQHNCWGTYRFLPVMYPEPRLEPNASLIRDGNNVQWMQSSPYLSDSKVMVRYAGVNKWDSLVANGKAGFYPGDEYLGLEYSGVNNDGVNVMGLVQKGALSTTVEAHPYLTWLLPPILTLEQAATIPLAFTLVSSRLCLKVLL